MIVDCYTHTWETAAKLGPHAARTSPDQSPDTASGESDGAGVSQHLASAEPVDTTIVLGFKSRYLNADIDNEQVAAYVKTHPDRLVGFAGIDPSNPKEAIAEMAHAQDDLSMPGLSIAPAAQDFHPSDSRAMLVYEEACRRRMPIVFHTGVQISALTKLEYAKPVLLDEVAREFPDLAIVIAHMGFPWMNETIALLAKHPNVYTEISWLLHQPWQAYQALLSAHQYGVMNKLLFGSGFPAASASHCIEDLYSINHLVHGTNLPSIPREQLRGIVERDALTLLGLPGRSQPTTPPSEQLHAIRDDQRN
ncbi:MAG: amidohydrolase [Planctomycetes bacterium]|nr:amidohydrolase [Planctomycetota bacterium]